MCDCTVYVLTQELTYLTRVQSKAYTEPSSFSSLFNLPYSKDIYYFSQARRIAPNRTPVVSVPCLTCLIARTFTTLARRGA